MLDVYMRSQFKKDYKRMLQQKGCTAAQFKIVLEYLVNEKPLPPSNRINKISSPIGFNLSAAFLLIVSFSFINRYLLL